MPGGSSSGCYQTSDSLRGEAITAKGLRLDFVMPFSELTGHYRVGRTGSIYELRTYSPTDCGFCERSSPWLTRYVHCIFLHVVGVCLWPSGLLRGCRWWPPSCRLVWRLRA